MTDAPTGEDTGAIRRALPAWAQVSETRLAHIGRVVAVLRDWAAAMQLGPVEAAAWRDAGVWHDALRDAPEAELREILGDHVTPGSLLHGPAAAHLLQLDGEQRWEVLDAIAHHTTGALRWTRTGRALYMADFLEPGRAFEAATRATLRVRAPTAFDAVFREVVVLRVAWAVREGLALDPETTALERALRS